MDPSAVGLQSVLVLLASSVIAVAVCQSLRLPPMVGYLSLASPSDRMLGVVSEREEIHRLAEFGVVFLMFSIGLEFSLSKLKSMRRLVFGLGFAQVGATVALAVGAAAALGRRGRSGLRSAASPRCPRPRSSASCSPSAASSTASHGREVIAVLLFQDLAVVPLLVLIPVLGQTADAIGVAVAAALAKAAAALGLVIVGGPRPMRRGCASLRGGARTSSSC